MASMAGLEIKGIDELRLRFSNPKIVRGQMRMFLRNSANLARADVRPRIPKGKTGRARRSVRTKLLLKQSEARVFSPLFYTRFLAQGTKRGIIARHMFIQSAAFIEPKIVDLGNEAMEQIVTKLRGG